MTVLKEKKRKNNIDMCFDTFELISSHLGFDDKWG